MINNFLNNRNFAFWRTLSILINDILLLNISLYLAYYLRIEYFIKFIIIKNVSIISTLIYLTLFFIFKIYKQYFRYFNPNSYQMYFKIYISFGVFFGLYTLFQVNEYIPRSLILIFPTIFFFLIITNRILVAKFFQDLLLINKQKRAIVFGFNPSNINALSSYVKIICFIDDKNINKKRIVNGINILSTSDFLSNFKNLNFNLLLIEDVKVFNKSKYKIRHYIIKDSILVQNISSTKNEIITSSYFDFNYFFNRKNKITSFGNFFRNKTILITGAGGSIGSNIVFQLQKTEFKKMILLDNSEYNLYKISKDLLSSSKTHVHLTDFNNKSEMRKILSSNKIDIIFHSAAYKHVPLIEKNPFSAIKNNFLDTYELMNLVNKFKVQNFCLISSDKAVRPTNIMGASKRLSELAICYFNNYGNKSTNFCSVRFGNVINSSGSVKPLFQNQIDNNLPITLTHRKIIRYFMTIEEAANLVLNTARISKGGEIFLLDMGEPIKLYDLAKLMVQFSGKTIKKDGAGDIEIKIIGLREGEKLYEELLVDKESLQSSIKSIYQSLETNIDNKQFKNLYEQISNSYNENNIQDLKKILRNKFINYLPKNEK